VRAAGATTTLPSAIKEAIRRVEPGLAVREVVTIDELAERTVSAERLVSRLTSAFGFLGVFVACFGLYGTIAYSVARRRNEIGVRLALGASPSSVRWMVIRETLVLAALGAVVGALLALPLGRLLSTLLFGLSPRDPLTLAASAALVVAFGSIAGAIPAWRASRVNPTSALRAD
jgi:ABC-type antimicrobial peptide transport system permease subunit